MISGRHRSSRQSSSPRSLNPDDALRHFALRVGAVVTLAALVVLVLAEVTELRGELAFTRFHRMKQLAEKSRYPTSLTRAVRSASADAELVMFFSKRNPDALWEVVVTCLQWSGNEGLEPLVRLRLGEKAARAAVLAVRAAPSDYEPWFWLARTQAALGLWKQAEVCLGRAQALAPPGTRMELLPASPEQGKAEAGDSER